MSLYTLLFIAIVILLVYIKKKISDLTELVQKTIAITEKIISHPKETAARVGAAVADTALTKLTSLLKTKKEST